MQLLYKIIKRYSDTERDCLSYLHVLTVVNLSGTKPFTSAKHTTVTRLEMWILRGYYTKAHNNRAEQVSVVPSPKLINHLPDVKGRVPNLLHIFTQSSQLQT